MPDRRRDNLVPLALIAAGVLFVGGKAYFDDQVIKNRQRANVERIDAQDDELRALRAEILSLKARLEPRP